MIKEDEELIADCMEKVYKDMNEIVALIDKVVHIQNEQLLFNNKIYETLKQNNLIKTDN